MLFYERLREERLKANLKQSELGEKAGVGKTAISMYETGEREPKLNTLIAMANLFDVSIDYLVGREPLAMETHQEQKLLHKFRNLSEEDKERLLRIADTLDI